MRIALLACLLFVACKPPPPVEPPVAPDGGHLSAKHLHSHNDYLQPRPLLDALDARLDSVEADLYFQNGDLRVSHDGTDIKGTLRDLYLDPLKARVDGNGGTSVYGDGKPFFLWLDLKENTTGLKDAVRSQLAAYPMLTVFNDDGEQTKAITIVLTGGGAKVDLAQDPAPRLWTRDAEPVADSDPPADTRWEYYAVNYGLTIFWNGSGTMPPTQKRNMQQIIDLAHAKGRQLRFYSSPDTPEYYGVAVETGVDFINTDKPAALRAYVDAL